MFPHLDVKSVVVCSLAMVALPAFAAQPNWLVSFGSASPANATVAKLLSERLQIDANLIRVRPLLMPNTYQISLLDKSLLSVLSDSRIRGLLTALPGAEAVGKDLRLTLTQQVPNDALYASNQASYLGAGGYASLNMPQAWQITRGGRQTVIAVLDSGILFDHPELRGRVLPGYDFVSDVSSAPNSPSDGQPFGSNDGDGIDPDPSDPGDAPPTGVACASGQLTSSFHGTGVASVAAALSDNLQGMAGIDWNARVLPVRISGRCGSASSSDILNGIYWALQFQNPDIDVPANAHLPDVINLSLAAPEFLFGTSCASGDGIFFTRAIGDAAALGVPFVVSAGNVQSSAGNAGANLQFPASCPNAIAAAAALPDGQLAFYSARGRAGNAITIAAPGDQNGEYLTAGNPGNANGSPNSQAHGLVFQAGTSFSAPMVSGVIALIKGLRPEISQPEVIDLLASTAKPLPDSATCSGGVLGGLVNPLFIGGGGQANPCAAGIIDPLAALQSVRGNAQPVANIPAMDVASGATKTLQASASSSGSGAALVYAWRQLAGPTVNLTGQATDTLTVGGLSNRPVVIGLTVTDAATNQTHSASTLLANTPTDLDGPTDTGADDASLVSVPVSGTPANSSNAAPSTTAPTQVAEPSTGGGGGSVGWLLLMGLLVFSQLNRLSEVARERRG